MILIIINFIQKSIQIPLSPDCSGNPLLTLAELIKIATESRKMETKKAQTIRSKTKNPTLFSIGF